MRAHSAKFPLWKSSSSKPREEAKLQTVSFSIFLRDVRIEAIENIVKKTV